MKVIKFFSIFLFLLGVFILSCDNIDDPFPEDLGQSVNLSGNDSLLKDSLFNTVVDTNVQYISDPTFNINSALDLFNFLNNNNWDTAVAPDNSNQRFVVLEEFTGHKCTFCPNGTREIVRLDAKYKDTLIPIGIHAGNFAVPNPTGTKYTTNFRVANGDGETYLQTFNVSGYPSGIVSRINQNASGLNTWEPDIVSNKNKPVLATLSMTNYSSSNQRAIRSNIKITWQQTLPESYNLQLFLVEDHIIDWQVDNGVEKPDYDHRHVLRKVVNDTFGKSLGAAIKDNTIAIQYIFDYDQNWKLDDLEVIAFIFDSDQSSYDIIQANAEYVK